MQYQFDQWTKAFLPRAKMTRLWDLIDKRKDSNKNLSWPEFGEYTSLMNEYEENRIQHEHQKGLSSHV